MSFAFCILLGWCCWGKVFQTTMCDWDVCVKVGKGRGRGGEGTRGGSRRGSGCVKTQTQNTVLLEMIIDAPLHPQHYTRYWKQV